MSAAVPLKSLDNFVVKYCILSTELTVHIYVT